MHLTYKLEAFLVHTANGHCKCSVKAGLFQKRFSWYTWSCFPLSVSSTAHNILYFPLLAHLSFMLHQPILIQQEGSVGSWSCRSWTLLLPDRTSFTQLFSNLVVRERAQQESEWKDPIEDDNSACTGLDPGRKLTLPQIEKSRALKNLRKVLKT